MIPARLSVTLLPFKAAMLCGDSGLLFVPLPDLDPWRVLYPSAPTRRRLSDPAWRFVESLKAVTP